MYGWAWRKLPGGWALKALESIALLAIVCAVLVAVVFPWVEPKLPFANNTVDGGGSATSPSRSPSATLAPRPSSSILPGGPAAPTAGTDVLPGG